MSWWDSNTFSSFASQALKNAQKKIDKVLDIKDSEAGGGNASQVPKDAPKGKATSSWNSWLGATSEDKDDAKDEKDEEEGRSSWSMPWGMDTSFTRQFSPSAQSNKSSQKDKDTSTKTSTSTKDTSTKTSTSTKTVKESPEPDVIQETANLSVDNSDGLMGSEETQSASSVIGNDDEKRHTAEMLEGNSQVESETMKDRGEEHGDKSQVIIQGGESDDTNSTVMFDQNDDITVRTTQDIVTSDVKEETKEESVEVGETRQEDYIPVIVVEEKESKDKLRDMVSNKDQQSLLETETQKEEDLLTEKISESVGRVDVSEETTPTKESESLPVISDTESAVSSIHKDVTDLAESVSIRDTSEKSEDFQCDIQLSDLMLASDRSQEDSVNTADQTGEGGGGGGSKMFTLEDSASVEDNDQTESPLSSSSNNIHTSLNSASVSSYFDSVTEDRIPHSEDDSNRVPTLPLSPSTTSSLGGTDSDTNKLDSSLDAYTSDDTVVEKSGEEQVWSKLRQREESPDCVDNQQSNADQADAEDQTQQELSPEKEGKSGSSGSVSPSSSYVKCMIEEAMDDNASDTHSISGEKSECSRSTGGHDSGDEISTTTSSDIEIISTPTPNGDGTKVVDLSPLRIALQKTANRGSLSHRRTDSQSTTSSRDGQCDQLSPGRDTETMGDDNTFSGERRLSQETGPKLSELPTLSEEKLDPQQQQKVLKLQPVPEQCELTPPDSQNQKLAELTEVLSARENKLVQLSKENLDLQETNGILRSQLQQVEAAREAELEDLNKVSSEFTQRLAESERRVNQTIREKESVKKQLQRTQEELEKKVKDKSLHNLLQEKDQQITELMQEGEKLSKQQLQVNTIIKKLRVKEKENESLITSQKKKLEDQKSELDHLRKVCESKDELEKKQTEAIGQLNSAVQKQEREISKLKSDLEDAQERVRGLQTALDNSYKEIADLHRSNAAQDSKAHEAALSVEMQVREELKLQLDQERKTFVQEKDTLIMQIEDLRLTLSRMEKEHNRREDMLRQEISDLQRHLQEDEARSQDLTQSVTSATRPLLRQIENLQSTYAAQSQSWEKVEKNLSERLADAQSQLATAVEKERSASEALMDFRSKVTSLETQISCLKQDKTQLTTQVDMLKTKLEVLEDSKNSDLAQLEATKQEMVKELSDVKKEKVFLEAQLDMEKTKVEQEKKKLALAHDQIAQLERETQRPVSRGSQSPLSISRTESVSGDTSAMFTSFTQDDLDRSFVLSPSTTKTSLYDSLRHSGAAAVMENIQSQLKQREGEIVQLRDDIQQLERTRESMARELVNLTNQNEELHSQLEQLPEYKGKLEEVSGRYNALLQMYGEKVEEADELRMDLQDVKEMYKAQIDHLLAK